MASRQIDLQRTMRHVVHAAQARLVPLTLASALREGRVLTSAQRSQAEEIKKRFGRELYSQLLFILTYRWVEPIRAEALWTGILNHRKHLSNKLGREDPFAVAALNQLSHPKSSFKPPVLVDESNLQDMIEMIMRDPLTGLLGPTLVASS